MRSIFYKISGYCLLAIIWGCSYENLGHNEMKKGFLLRKTTTREEKKEEKKEEAAETNVTFTKKVEYLGYDHESKKSLVLYNCNGDNTWLSSEQEFALFLFWAELYPKIYNFMEILNCYHSKEFRKTYLINGKPVCEYMKYEYHKAKLDLKADSKEMCIFFLKKLQDEAEFKDFIKYLYTEFVPACGEIKDVFEAMAKEYGKEAFEYAIKSYNKIEDFLKNYKFVVYPDQSSTEILNKIFDEINQQTTFMKENNGKIVTSQQMPSKKIRINVSKKEEPKKKGNSKNNHEENFELYKLIKFDKAVDFIKTQLIEILKGRKSNIDYIKNALENNKIFPEIVSVEQEKNGVVKITLENKEVVSTHLTHGSNAEISFEKDLAKAIVNCRWENK